MWSKLFYAFFNAFTIAFCLANGIRSSKKANLDKLSLRYQRCLEKLSKVSDAHSTKKRQTFHSPKNHNFTRMVVDENHALVVCGGNRVVLHHPVNPLQCLSSRLRNSRELGSSGFNDSTAALQNVFSHQIITYTTRRMENFFTNHLGWTCRHIVYCLPFDTIGNEVPG